MPENLIDALDVDCDRCGAEPGRDCTTPNGKYANPHTDRRGNAFVIRRYRKRIGQDKFDENTAKVVASLLKNAGHSFGVPFAELNDLCIELRKRGVDIPD